MLRLYGDEIGRISNKVLFQSMKKSQPDQTYFVDCLNRQTDIDRLQASANQRTLQIEFLEKLNNQAIKELKDFCRELPVNYSRRYPIVDKFLNGIADHVLILYGQYELMYKILDALDSFCGGDFDAVKEINES